MGEVLDVRAERLFDARAGQALLSLRLASAGSWLHARVRAPVRTAALRSRLKSIAPSVPASGGSREELAERTRIVQAMTESRWQPLTAAAMLGVSRATLYRRLKHFRIVPPHKQ